MLGFRYSKGISDILEKMDYNALEFNRNSMRLILIQHTASLKQ